MSTCNPKNLTDLPKEILTKILEEALSHSIESDDRVDVHCDGSRLMTRRGVNFLWPQKWVPQLRLVSKWFESVASPVISRNTRVCAFQRQVSDQVPPQQELLKVQKVCPRFMVPNVEHIVLSDSSLELMSLAWPLDITGLPNVRVLQYENIDIACVLNNAFEEFKRTDIFQKPDHASVFLRPYLEGEDGIDTKDLTSRWVDGLGPTAAMRKVMNFLLKAFEDTNGYRSLLEKTVTNFFKLKPDNIQGFMRNTLLNINFVDTKPEDAGQNLSRYRMRNPTPNFCPTACLQYSATGECSATLDETAIIAHKESKMMEIFNPVAMRWPPP